jgi:hypothetical protein
MVARRIVFYNGPRSAPQRMKRPLVAFVGGRGPSVRTETIQSLRGCYR